MSESVPNFPHAPMAERAVISCMMKRPSWIARGKAEGINSDSFYLPQFRALYLAVCEWNLNRNPETEGEIELIGFVGNLGIEGKLDSIGGASEIAATYSFANQTDGWPTWCSQLREMRARRMAMTAAGDMLEAVDSEEAIQCAKRTFDALSAAVSGKARAITAKQASEDFISQFMADHAAGDIPGKATGIQCLDSVTGGMRPGELWVVGAPTSGGKSVLMFQIASEFLDRGEAVAVFTLEMTAREVVGRMVSFVGRVNYDAITQPKKATKHDLGRIRESALKIAKSNLWIDDSANQGSDYILTEAERIRDIHGSLGLVVVDYLQLISGGRAKGESREQEVAKASGGLKQLAKHLGCPVISATQLTDDGRTRESRAIGMDADNVLLVEDEGIRMAKVRNGQRGALLPLLLDGSGQRFNYNQHAKPE